MQEVDLGDKVVHSVFQPIFSFPNQACVGVEALVRGKIKDGSKKLSAYECLKVPECINQHDFAQSLNHCHLSNWKSLQTTENWLFLNLDFDNVSSFDEFCLGDLLDELQINGRQVVVEVVESEIKDEKLFEELIFVLRKQGCLIALDDFGAGHSNVDRIWKAQPDIVKLDRQVLLEASKSVRSQSILRNLTKLIQQSGSIALLEGIETKEQALLAMNVGVDLVQGFYFARPHEDFSGIEKGEELVREITNNYPTYLSELNFVRNIQRKGYEALFETLNNLASEQQIEAEMLQISNMSFVKRFFVLDEQGYQVSEEYGINEQQGSGQDVLKKGKGLCWKNRRYFTKAMATPNDIYISEPYRSLIDVELCLTISKVINSCSGEKFIACYDVYYHDKSTSTVQISI